MKVNGVDYNVKYSFRPNYMFGFYDVDLTSGNIRRYDRGLSADYIESNVSINAKESELKQLLIDLSSDPTIVIESYEKIFGIGVVAVSPKVASHPVCSRINNTFYNVSVTLVSETNSIGGDGTDKTLSLNYPSSYSNGTQKTFEYVANTDGSLFTWSKENESGVHSLTFDLPDSIAIDLKSYIIYTVRGNAFQLNSDWVTLNPFSPKDWDYALIMGMSESKSDFVSTSITLDLKGYDNG